MSDVPSLTYAQRHRDKTLFHLLSRVYPILLVMFVVVTSIFKHDPSFNPTTKGIMTAFVLLAVVSWPLIYIRYRNRMPVPTSTLWQLMFTGSYQHFQLSPDARQKLHALAAIQDGWISNEQLDEMIRKDKLLAPTSTLSAT